jgi:hypothetical protein
MLFVKNVNGVDYGVKFVHFQQNERVRTTECNIYIVPTGHKMITDNSCNKFTSGRFNQFKRAVPKITRRKMALKQALKGIPKEQRLYFWNIYFEKWPNE